MRELTETSVAEAVLASISNCSDARLQDVMNAIIRHVSGFNREIEPSQEECMRATCFLLETAETCDERRNEFILFSDVIAATIIVGAINNRKSPGATDSSVIGPFHVSGAPDYSDRADLRGDKDGEPLLVRRMVTDTSGIPLADAMIDIWQAGSDGLCHMQAPASNAAFAPCGKLASDSAGAYEFCRAKPVSYAIPSNGTVGKVSRSPGRHFQRPAQIHAMERGPIRAWQITGAG